MGKETLADRIVALLVERGETSMSSWNIANALYDNCMTFPKAGNGIKIANIRRAGENDSRLKFYVGSNEEGIVMIISKD